MYKMTFHDCFETEGLFLIELQAEFLFVSSWYPRGVKNNGTIYEWILLCVYKMKFAFPSYYATITLDSHGQC